MDSELFQDALTETIMGLEGGNKNEDLEDLKTGDTAISTLGGVGCRKYALMKQHKARRKLRYIAFIIVGGVGGGGGVKFFRR